MKHDMQVSALATSTFTRLENKVLGSLSAAVIGDALGAPTEQRSMNEIRQLFGGRVETFFAPPGDSPYAKGRKAAQFTDDSSQMIMLAEAFVRGNGQVTSRDVADMLITWSRNPDYFPHFAGPSTRRAIEALENGADPDTIGAEGREATMGASNGGAMRVAPAGLVHPGDVEGAVRAAAVTCRPSHFTSIGVSGAGAVAAAVAVALRDDATILDVVRAALHGAELGHSIGAMEGREVAGAHIGRRIELAVRIASTSPDLDTAVRDIAQTVGTGLHAAEAVPAAIGFFVAAAGDPWLAAVAAANSGDDTDTVGCMACSIAGAYAGFDAVPADKLAQVLEANNLDLNPLAADIARVARATL
ncbi:ADP-ribosylglycohydrolase family protein [Flaviflexus huanghaiensis]|uniref:ADP-ribosylglycohydrolase family protein n=1 Tax=Flaviflexus huanghaiensis TaxID=1111473 RepID=UPI0015FC6B35|nr:ADP-ribosylglycohydrolase family protein [Flaviflexus huanghaiensis]